MKKCESTARLRSKRLHGVREQRKSEERDCWCFIRTENNGGKTMKIPFHSIFIVTRPHGNACYAGLSTAKGESEREKSSFVSYRFFFFFYFFSAPFWRFAPTNRTLVEVIKFAPWKPKQNGKPLILFFPLFAQGEWHLLITSELANQSAWKALFPCNYKLISVILSLT